MEIIQVVFNVLDPDQLQLYRHASSRKNRSGYLKRLIQRDMDSAAAVAPSYARATTATAAAEDFNAEGFI